MLTLHKWSPDGKSYAHFAAQPKRNAKPPGNDAKKGEELSKNVHCGHCTDTNRLLYLGPASSVSNLH